MERNQLLKSFLDSTTINTEISDEEDMIVDQTYNCVVCLIDLGSKPHFCKFCRGPACMDHLRKKRKLKNTFERICDQCEDKLIFEALMKHEISLLDSLTVQEEILLLKKGELDDMLIARQSKKRMLQDQKNRLEEERVKSLGALEVRYEKLLKMQEYLTRQDKIIQEEELKLNQIQEVAPEAIYLDYEYMEKENRKLTKQLLSLQARIDEVKRLTTQSQRQLSDTYTAWQQAKTVKQDEIKPKEKCLLF